MPRRWTEDQSWHLWQSRPWVTIGRDDNIVMRETQRAADEQQRINRDRADQDHFAHTHNATQQHPNAQPFLPTEDAENLSFWAMHASHTYCSTCKKLVTLPLLPRYRNRPLVKPSNTCPCHNERYFTPNPNDIPHTLKNLSHSEICALRPLTIHTGDYVRLENGYRKKNGMLRLTWSNQSVMQQITQLPDPRSQHRCIEAYRHLMSQPLSAYQNFVDKRQQITHLNEPFNVYDNDQNQYVECCLWPNLYPTRAWCESALDGRQSTLSMKIGFLTKVNSSITDYGTTYELLHFQYDRWLFRTVSGAITTGQLQHCSPARSLETKPFSVEYWKWQHRFLLDAVTQYGPPSLFLTISPYEWTFPTPPWLTSLRHITGKGPTQLAAFETTHITHVLEQVIRGYLCGSNNKKWTSHVFNYNHIANYPNVQTYFYRFEFQNRGTVHVHLLVWLKDLSRIRIPLLRADIPWSSPTLAYDVSNLQASDKASLPLRDTPTNVTTVNNNRILSLHHPADAFAHNLRGYISSLTPSLKCRMDVQTSDGRSMILRYVASYVSKWHDAYDNDALYSVHVGSYQAAYKHLTSWKPLEPEMWLALTSTKISWTPSRRKKFRFPPLHSLDQNATYQRYLTRPPPFINHSLLQWLCEVDETKATPTLYKTGSTLVGVKSVSPLKDLFYFQHLILHHPHSSTNTLYHRDYDRLPPQIKFFTCTHLHMHSLWSDSKQVHNYFSTQGHKTTFVDTMVQHVSSMINFLHLWQRRVLTVNHVPAEMPNIPEPLQGPIQNQVIQVIKIALAQRDNHYRSHHQPYLDPADDDSDNDDQPDIHEQPAPIPHHNDIDWRKFILLTGKPGTGKTHCIRKSINQSLDDQRKILVATPTGFLATTYSSHFLDEIVADTVHSAFKYPVNPDDRPEINWDLSEFDLAILDEISMIPKRIVDHIIQSINQLPTRPIVVMSGDVRQQQPIETTDQQTQQVKSILQHPPFYNMVHHFNLTTQHRSDDPKLQEILNYLHYYKPSQRLLDEIHQNRTLSPTSQVTPQQITTALTSYPTATILTVSRAAANTVNQVALQTLFPDQTPLTHVQTDCELPPLPLYKDMKVIITQNRDKPNGFMNGQIATIHTIQGHTVFLQLPPPRLTILNSYPVTSHKPDGTTKCTYPFVPAFALTICKCQGQTLPKAIIWMDCVSVPPGAAYVALSRVHRLDDLHFMTPTTPSQYAPVNIN